MARLQGVKRINRNDFPKEMKDAVERIGYSFNSFAEEVVNIINGGKLTLENLNRRVINIKVKLGASGVPVNEVIIQPNVSGLQGFNVIRAVSTQGTVFPTSQPFINYKFMANGNVIVTTISGLPDGEEFTLTIEVIGN